jgi:putative hydroxymethylpyrimidine transport system permease protein
MSQNSELTPAESARTAGKREPGRLAGFVRKYWASVLIVVVAIALSQLLLRLFRVPIYVLPTPSDVGSGLITGRNDLLSQAVPTAFEVLLGFGLSVIAGLAIAFALHFSKSARQAVYPVLVASQTIPIIVIAPVLVVALGFGVLPKLVLVVLICFFPIVVTTIEGLESVSQDQKDLMRSLYATRSAIFRRVEVPSALPMFFSGARIAATYAAIGAVVGEWSGASSGLGYYIMQQVAFNNTGQMFAAVIALCVMAFVLVGAVSLVERLVAPWGPRFVGGQR